MYNGLADSPLFHIAPGHHQQSVSQKSAMAACLKWFSKVAKKHQSLVEHTNYLHIKQDKIESMKIGQKDAKQMLTEANQPKYVSGWSGSILDSSVLGPNICQT